MKNSSVKDIVLDGGFVDYKGLTICDLSHFSESRRFLKKKYQVDVHKAKIEWSSLYDDVDTAVDKFMLLYGQMQ